MTTSLNLYDVKVRRVVALAALGPGDAVALAPPQPEPAYLRVCPSHEPEPNFALTASQSLMVSDGPVQGFM